MSRLRLVTLLLLAPTMFVASGAAAKPRDAETWVSLTVAPALVRELATHPRFRAESIRVVVFADDRPAASSNAFALSLRDRLANAIFDTPGIRMAAERDPGRRLDCTLNDVDYFIGLQISYLGNDEYRIDLRTLDIADQAFVTGFERTWQGQLTQSQQSKLEISQSDPWFRGARSAPYDEKQSDLLAADLAHELACASLRQTTGEYVVLLESSENEPQNRATELVGKNLTALASLQFTDDPAQANAVLRGKSHSVDVGLNQYWATIVPIDTASELPALSANAYVRYEPPEIDPLDALLNTQAVLSPAALVDVPGQGVAMQVQAKRNAVVFFLNHQQRYGLVHLSGRECRSRPEARVVRAEESLSRALPVSTLMPDAASATNGWSLTPPGDTYYAIAVSDSAAAHALSRHIQKLPQRCTTAARFGLRDEELEEWLTVFASIVDSQREHVDWQAIQVRNVY
ncbi:MAG: hypothetical protein GTN98_15335 [Woeseiaceae bacterium]|nr:hypothetical protein [Woeseiaceae bacterium]